MRTLVILGLLASLAMVAPVASAHIVVYLPGDACGSPSIVLPTSPVHAWVNIGALNADGDLCEFDHGAIPEDLVLPLP